MTDTPRIALIHALAHSVAPVNAAFDRLWPDCVRMNLVDDSLSVDLAAGRAKVDNGMTSRFVALATYAVRTDACGILFTCSAFGPCIEEVAHRFPTIPVLKPFDAMIEEAVRTGQVVGLIASFAATLDLLPQEFPAGRRLEPVLAEGALDALNAGDTARHDALVVEAARRACSSSAPKLRDPRVPGPIAPVTRPRHSPRTPLMRDYLNFYINGHWVPPVTPKLMDVINPATGTVNGHISAGSAADVDAAVVAARAAFESWSLTTREVRMAALERIVAEFERRLDDMGEAIMEEMGAPNWLARNTQAALGPNHFKSALNILRSYAFEEDHNSARILKEPIGVCGFITPWNWPVHQMCAKTAPAIAVGCTVLLKPSEIAPFSGQILAEVIAAADLPPGVFNLVNGEGPVVGAAMSLHPDIDMISITGSTRAGIEVARNAAATVKRVHQELGGKSPNIVLDDADLKAAVTGGVNSVMMNSGQSCRAPTRMLVPREQLEEICAIAREVAQSWTPGDPTTGSRMGPVISQAAWEKVQNLIKAGIDGGATLVTGGLGKPDGLESGYFCKPTVFCDVTNDMRIAREEIFGPVLCIISYDDEDEAVRIANDTEYGLGGYVQSQDIEHARRIARKIRAGYISLNNAGLDINVPFGGYKHSGNGREFGEHSFGEFLEVKSVLGYAPA